MQLEILSLKGFNDLFGIMEKASKVTGSRNG
jgi:hypothetical protein